MYKRTIWQDHVEGIQNGTDMNAANFNKIEAGTMEANALAAMNSEYQRYENDISENNKVYVVEANLSGSNTVHSVNFHSWGMRNFSPYNIFPQIISVEGGTAGDIIPITLQANGFTVKYTGTASKVKVNFAIMGGMYHV